MNLIFEEDKITESYEGAKDYGENGYYYESCFESGKAVGTNFFFSELLR